MKLCTDRTTRFGVRDIAYPRRHEARWHACRLPIHTYRGRARNSWRKPWMEPLQRVEKTTKPACRRAKSMMQGTVMTHQTLASCLIIPQHLSIAIDGGVHLNGLSLVIVIVLWIMIRKKPLGTGVVPSERPLLRHTRI